MAQSRADKLKDLKMPSKPMADEEVEMDLAMEEMDALEGEELPEGEEMLAEDEMALEEAGMLEEYSDEELIEEMKKRGLMPEDEEGDEELAEEEMPEDEEELEV